MSLLEKFGLRRTSPTRQLIDGFTFFNELDLLEIRLKYLYDTVDQFVLVEATTTHTGLPKPLYFEENKARFAWAMDKITHIVEELPAEDQVPEGADGPWLRENQQRNAIAKGLEGANADALVLIGDLDEIPDRDTLAKSHHITTPHKLRQLYSYYYVNNFCYKRRRRLRHWSAAVLLPLNTLNTPQEVREASLLTKEYPTLNNGGWHFSYLGGKQAILEKLNSFAHTECNTDAIRSETNIEKALDAGHDIFSRDQYHFRRVEMTRFPVALRELLSQYPHIIKP